MKYLAPMLCLCLLAGCTQFPEVDAAEGARVDEADYPRLLPLDQILDAPESLVDATIEEQVEGRVARLKARADWIRNRTVIDKATRRRMETGITIPE